MSLLVSSAAKERGTVDDHLDIANRGLERIGVLEVALSELDTSFSQVNCTASLAHESTDLIATLSQPFGQAAPDFSGRAGDEYFHAHTIAIRPRRELEESDTGAGGRLRDHRARQQNRSMDGSSVNFNRVAPGISAGSAVAALFVDEYDRVLPRVTIPRPAVQVVVRFGPVARGGLDVHAFGVQQRVRRKFIRACQRAVMASLHPGVAKAVLGVPADAIAGRVLELDQLWG